MYSCEVYYWYWLIDVDGAVIAGLERTAVYEEQQVEKEKKEDDSVLKMLMKKTGMVVYYAVSYWETC